MIRHRRAALALLLAVGGSGCSAVRARSTNPGPLGADGELYVYLQPLAREVENVTFGLAGVDALGPGEDGVQPIRAVLSEVDREGHGRQRLLAQGRLAAGTYSGFRLHVGRARIETPDGPSDLLVRSEAVQVTGSFTVLPGRAQVLWLIMREAQPPGDEVAFAPRFSLVAPEATHPQRLGYCASAADNALIAFDRYERQVTAAIATGMGPAGVAMDESANLAYVALSLEDRIEVLDLTNGQVREPIRLRPGDGPYDVALVDGGRTLLTVNRRSSTVSFLDTSARVEIGRVAVGEEPWSLRLDPPRHRAYVFGRRSNTVTTLDVTRRAAVGSATTEPEPLRGDLDRSGSRLFVVHAGSAYLSIYTLPELTPAGRLFVGLGASAILVDPRTDLLYVAQSGSPVLAIYDPFSLVPLGGVDVGGGASFLAFDAMQNLVFALLPERRAVSVIDLTAQRQVGLFEVGGEPYDLAIVGERR
ncbi:conserved hypothetical protein [Anaeromyxobacter dehalogenans 2CP-1]|uniref:YncE family protein n=1 Tax=Anaeromyxobacter dehalogenans (strain ATCC BAA-258 / DSM 21875 / 2CP-1) TaxID=455488 RepID=B8JGW3_ANAD2|nr:YncE family protein [Anaeromyxobacter dehalogenans]ACL66600.1 conserved hypothetical protein [Anaeromyxobacter dehalogenans 2CP-1]